MSIQQLDFYFPFIVFGYGFVMTLVTQSPRLRQQALESMDSRLVDWFYGHRLLGQICLGVGFLWGLQRLFLY